jgi:hypothetical protein
LDNFFKVLDRVARFFLAPKYQNGKSKSMDHKLTMPNGHILYRTAIYNTKRSYIIPKGHKLYRMSVKNTNISIPRPFKIYPD